MPHKTTTGSSPPIYHRHVPPRPNQSINQLPVLLAFHLSHTRPHPHLQFSFTLTPRRLRPTASICHVPTTLALALPSSPLLASLLHRTSDSFAHLVQTLLRID